MNDMLLVDVWFVLRVDVLDCFDQATTLYFFEPGKTTNIEPFANENMLSSISTFATMGPDRRRYNQFVKVANVVYMPVFTMEELLAIGRDMKARPDFPRALENLYSDKEIRGRFEIFNGIIRHVLPRDQRGLQRVLEERTAALDCIKYLYSDNENRTVSHYAAVYDVAVDENGVYDFFKMRLSIVDQEIKKKLTHSFSLNEGF